MHIEGQGHLLTIVQGHTLIKRLKLAFFEITGPFVTQFWYMHKEFIFSYDGGHKAKMAAMSYKTFPETRF